MTSSPPLAGECARFRNRRLVRDRDLIVTLSGDVGECLPPPSQICMYGAKAQRVVTKITRRDSARGEGGDSCRGGEERREHHVWRKWRGVKVETLAVGTRDAKSNANGLVVQQLMVLQCSVAARLCGDPSPASSVRGSAMVGTFNRAVRFGTCEGYVVRDRAGSRVQGGSAGGWGEEQAVQADCKRLSGSS